MKLHPIYQDRNVTKIPEINNWRGNHLNPSLYYSCRETRYDRQSYPARLHCHDYYELVVFLEGEIRYICEDQTFRPQYGDVILIPPHRFHMSVIDAGSTVYRRHVFYLYSDALDAAGCSPLMDFLTNCEAGPYFYTLDRTARQELCGLLDRLEATLRTGDEKDRALATGLILQIFYLLGSIRSVSVRDESPLPHKVIEIRQYIDAHFSEIEHVSQVARHFYYSREYVSRLFRQYFNTTVAEYIMQRRVAQSQVLIAEGKPLSDVCFQVGFGSMTTFIRSFRSMTKMTPGQYRGAVSK